ncbi:MAG: radical SAM protein [Candidatus Bathyarchaeota archaeon]
MVTEESVPKKIRVSLGSAILLGLKEGTMDAKPTTIYLLTYHTSKCTANCSFCSQSRSSTSKSDLLSRVVWPAFSTKRVIERMKDLEKGLIKRTCIQVMNYPNVFRDVLGLVRRIHIEVGIPTSISCQPLTSKRIRQLSDAGIDRVGIPLDASTESLFEQVKGSIVGGPYLWERNIEALKTAVQTLGKGRVSTHLIVGLGEKDEEIIRAIQEMIDMYVYPALFAFTPITGTVLESKTQPQIERYRCIQIAHYLMTHDEARFEDMVFDEKGHIRSFSLNEDLLKETVKGGLPFMTSGCPGCNRPFYNERPQGPLYNYPRKLNIAEMDEIETSFWRYLNG